MPPIAFHLAVRPSIPGGGARDDEGVHRNQMMGLDGGALQGISLR